jgi:lipopolysaccharide/colanic/teichoic acid biosynthesis glycosyltransferase
MADRTHVTTSTTSEALLAPIYPFPAERLEPRPRRQDEDLEAIAEDLERLVDARRERLRRTFDVVAAAAALLVLAPVLLVVALAIKLDSPGPVFYVQDRIGQNRRRSERRLGARAAAGRRVVINAGRPFRIWKFRTMRQDAEAAGPQWARTADPRITRVGRFLRKTRLDEVPQFINVLKGDMTLIGPRPERSFFIQILEAEIPHYSKRLLVKPGITGLAQVNNGYDDSVESVRKKVSWDLRYIRGRGLRTDLEILAKTVRTVLTGEGAC